MAFLSQAPRLEGLLPSHGAFQGHAAHLMRWSMRLSPNGSRGTCIPPGLTTFLHAAFTAHRMADHTPKLPARVHPDDRDRIEGLNTLARLYYGTPQAEAPVSYYTPILIQCTLPHSDPKTRDWKKTNGDFTLIISSGVDNNLVPYGIPYGS